MKKIILILSVVCLFNFTACKPSDHDHDHEHFDGMPHNGTGVAIGDHGFHLELVIDPTASKMQAYVLDDHAEHYETVSEQSFELIARWEGKEEKVRLERVPDPKNAKE